MNLANITIKEFTDFVGNSIFTAVFKKKDGSVRTMNARLKVAKFVKGTAPEATAKRKQTLTSNNMIGVWEASTEQFNDDGTKKTGEEKYRTLNLETLLELRANGQKLVNELATREAWEGWENVGK